MSKVNINRKRHLAKTLTWRVTATITTIIITWLITGDKTAGLAVGSIEFFAKMTIYYFHERVWYKNNWGVIKK